MSRRRRMPDANTGVAIILGSLLFGWIVVIAAITIIMNFGPQY
jgi:hypothetical protein